MLKPVDPDMLRSKVAMLLELQQKSAELRASEERFRAAFEGAPIGMGLSTVNGRWLEVNDALCELLGRSQTQLLRQPLWDLVHPGGPRDTSATRCAGCCATGRCSTSPRSASCARTARSCTRS